MIGMLGLAVAAFVAPAARQTAERPELDRAAALFQGIVCRGETHGSLAGSQGPVGLHRCAEGPMAGREMAQRFGAGFLDRLDSGLDRGVSVDGEERLPDHGGHSEVGPRARRVGEIAIPPASETLLDSVLASGLGIDLHELPGQGHVSAQRRPLELRKRRSPPLGSRRPPEMFETSSGLHRPSGIQVDLAILLPGGGRQPPQV